MRKIILFSIITGLLLFILPATAVAENQAGSSANLSINTILNKEEQTTIDFKKKELAIKSVLSRYNSPMANEAKSFIETCKEYNLDCYLLPSIAGLESTFGRFILPNSFNAFGWDRGYMMFSSWKDGIDTVGKGLRENYINKWGLLSVNEIGPIYSESPTWAIRVNWFIDQFKAEEEKLSLLSLRFPVEL